jgi:hypothetical protein
VLGRHCCRCGRPLASLLPGFPPPDASPSARRGLAAREADAPAFSFLVCAGCLGLGGPYRFCARCGQETPHSELQGDYCDWRHAADDIPFEEPADDAWWKGKVPGSSPPGWWPRV